MFFIVKLPNIPSKECTLFKHKAICFIHLFNILL